MIRFRNPGTQYNTQIQVIKQLYDCLGNDYSFTLKDMAEIIAKNKLMTAYGYAGSGAIKLSKDKSQKKESMNSALMNSKMYAEVFRMLGWITPLGEKAYPVIFTNIGIHMATASNDAIKEKLYEQCVLGINNPTELSNRMSYDEKIRFFKCALRSIIDLDGIIYKHELCLGPMSINDEDEVAYHNMISYIKSIRGSYKRLDQNFKGLARSLGMKPVPVDNCTRLPIAFMKACKWVKSVKNNTIYDKSLNCLEITQHGIDVYNQIKNYCDIRLDSYKTYSYEEEQALIRLGHYSMLERSGYDISGVRNQILIDKSICRDILKGKEILFSPYQTLRHTDVEQALNLDAKFKAYDHSKVYTPHPMSEEKNIYAVDQHRYVVNEFALNKDMNAAKDLLIEKEDEDFLSFVLSLKQDGKNDDEIINYLYNYYQTATQNIFYPLVATLFKIMGFDCSFSRAGDNGSRWDAIIKDKSRSIPIEIKSPTEVPVLSIKAIRQALENKIVLLSRKTFITQPDTTSLAVGNAMPGDRTDINDLIYYIKKTYGYRIGIIDFKTLLSVGISILFKGKGFDKEELYKLEGLLYVHTI